MHSFTEHKKPVSFHSNNFSIPTTVFKIYRNVGKSHIKGCFHPQEPKTSANEKLPDTFIEVPYKPAVSEISKYSGNRRTLARPPKNSYNHPTIYFQARNFPSVYRLLPIFLWLRGKRPNCPSSVHTRGPGITVVRAYIYNPPECSSTDKIFVRVSSLFISAVVVARRRHARKV